MIILGIDPGFERLGCAVLKKDKSGEKIIYSTCITTDKKLFHEKRLLILAKELKKIIAKYKPDVLATEKVFFFKNQKTALKVAETRGMILYLAALNNLDVVEFTPLEVKMSLTGYGRAEKRQVEEMVKQILKIPKMPKSDDEIDAMAIAMTCSTGKKLKDIHRNL